MTDRETTGNCSRCDKPVTNRTAVQLANRLHTYPRCDDPMCGTLYSCRTCGSDDLHWHAYENANRTPGHEEHCVSDDNNGDAYCNACDDGDWTMNYCQIGADNGRCHHPTQAGEACPAPPAREFVRDAGSGRR